MATQVVELSGDEANLLRALDKIIQKEKEHERALARMAESGDQAGLQLEDAMGRIEKANQEAIKNTIKELSKLGPEGKRAADELQAGFREIGKGGMPGTDQLLAKIASLDDTTAEVVASVKQKLAEADQRNAFEQTLAGMKALGGEAAAVASEIQNSLKSKASDPDAFKGYLDRLNELDPEAARIAEQVRIRLSEADRENAFSSTLAAMKQLGGDAAAVAKEIQSRLAESDPPGAFDEYLQQLVSLNPESAKIAEEVRANLAIADRENAFNETLTAMKALGGDAAIVAKEIQAQLAQSNPPGAFDDYLEQLASLNPESAKIAEQVKANLAQANQKTQFDETLKSLRNLGPAGKKIADGLEDNLKTAAAEAAGGMDAIIERLAAMNPEIEQVAAKIKTEIAAADAESKFDNTIIELQKINPKAAAAAKKIREQMDLADAEVKFDNIIAELQKIDPAAAIEAGKLRDRMKTGAEEGTTAWTTFSQSAVTQIGAVAGAYLGVQEAIEWVSKYLREQEQLIQAALEKQIELAKAQQEAAKNLVALDVVQQDQILTEAASSISQDAGVSQVAVTQALGGVISAGANKEQAISAVTAASQLNVLTPEKIAPTASAAIDLSKATKIEDARSNIALLASTGAQARIEDPLALAKAIAPVLTNSVATVPTQDRAEASREAAAIFAAFTQATGDTTGDKSSTATIQFTTELGNFFSNLEGQQRDARSELNNLDKKIDEGKASESETFKAVQLRDFLQQASKITDPGTLFGRVEALQQNDGLSKKFFSKEFGDAAFKGVFKALADEASDTALLTAGGKTKIQTDSAGFDRLVENTTGLTPQITLANFVAGQQASRDVRDANNNEGAVLAAIRNETETTLQRTRAEGVTGFLNALALESNINSSLGGFIPGGSLSGSTAVAEGVSAIEALQSRLRLLEEDGISATEAPKVQELNRTIEKLETLLIKQLEEGGLSAESARETIAQKRGQAQFVRRTAELDSDFARAEQMEMIASKIEEALNKQSAAIADQNRLMEEQNSLLAATEANTRPVEEGPPDYNSLQNAGLAEEDSR